MTKKQIAVMDNQQNRQIEQMKRFQKGVGLVEVLVALLLLAIAVLGFVSLQIRAVAASSDAVNNLMATNLARDLSDRILINREGVSIFSTSPYTGETSKVTKCATQACSAAEMAKYDFEQVRLKAQSVGMNIAVNACQGVTLVRKCVYVSWGKTTPTDGTATTDCTNGTSYVDGAKCIIMEVYNHG